jgi:hypothetical protein
MRIEKGTLCLLKSAVWFFQKTGIFLTRNTEMLDAAVHSDFE